MHDWHLRDEVFGSARKSQRWRSARWLFGAMSRPHGVENSSDDIELGHFANHAQLAELDIENLFESRHPTPRRTALWLGSIGACGTTIGCPGLDDEAAVSGVRREYAVISEEMRSWARYQGRQTGDEVVRFEQYVRRCISKWPLQLLHHQTIPIDTQARFGYRWTRPVSAVVAGSIPARPAIHGFLIPMGSTSNRSRMFSALGARRLPGAPGRSHADLLEGLGSGRGRVRRFLTEI